MRSRSIAFCWIIAVLCVWGAASGNAQSLSPEKQRPPDGTPSANQSVTVTPAADDAAIANRLQGILESTGWYERPRVSVSQGIVSLDGTATSEEHKRWAADLAEKTQDVVAVVNRIEVEADPGSTLERAGNELRSVLRHALQSWPLVALAIVILIVTWVLAKLASALARHLLRARITSPLLLTVVARAIAFPVFVLGIYFVLQIAGLTRLALTILGGTGLIGIIIGFAFRDIAENFLASLLLSIRNPFRSGDLVEITGHTGVVQNLNTRSTVLLTLDGRHVQIPNATVYKSTITNFSSSPSRRATFAVGIGYESSASKAQKLISRVLREHPAVNDSPEPLVLLEELGAASVSLRINYWFDSNIHSPARINSALLRQTKNVLIEEGISLPDPAREIIFPNGVPVTVLKSGDVKAPPAGPPSGKPPDQRDPDDMSDATIGEGNLASERSSISEQPECGVAEATENLLKD